MTVPAAEFVDLVAELGNILAYVSSPRLRERWDAKSFGTLKAGLEDAIARFESASRSAELGSDAYSGTDGLIRLRRCSNEFLEMLGDAPEGLDLPEHQAKARECLAAMGISDPPGGWDVFEGKRPEGDDE
jgi:hypothetical protein